MLNARFIYPVMRQTNLFSFPLQHAWPRTPTERLMTDLQGTAAKFLAILEALSETYRRTLHCEAPTPDAEDTAIDVCAELFFAGMEIIAGGGGIKQALKHDGVIHPSVWELQNTSIMELVAKGKRKIFFIFSSSTFLFSSAYLFFAFWLNSFSFMFSPSHHLVSFSFPLWLWSSVVTCVQLEVVVTQYYHFIRFNGHV